MAISASTIWEFNASATASMVNGGGFNYLQTSPMVNGSWTSANTNSPVLTSATYSFVAGDVGNWVYSSNTSIPGFYKISSVAAGAATVNAAIGAGVILDATTKLWKPNTTAGVDASASVSSKTFLVDYSQATAGILSLTDGACTTPSTTFTSVTGGFTPAMVGNIIHINSITGAGTLTGWYEITAYTNTNTVTLDRTPAPTANATAAVFTVGGALSANASTEDAFYEQIVGGNTVWWKSGTFTAASVVSVASTSSTGLAPSNTIGYTSIRGDTCTGANRPTIALGANSYTFGQFQNVRNLIFTGTATTVVTFGTGARTENLKFLNSSNAGTRAAWATGADNFAFNIESVSQTGRSLRYDGNNAKVIGLYTHDSDTGIFVNSSRAVFINCIVQACNTVGINAATTTCLMTNCTIQGYTTPVTGSTGVLIPSGVDDQFLLNNIVSGWATGISQTTTQRFSNSGAYNCLSNNTTNVTNYSLNPTDITTSPSYTSVTELSGSTATISGSVLTQSGGDFSTVTDNVDYLLLISGTGGTVGQYLITSHTATTVTLNNAIGTNATADKVWRVVTGRNLSVGTNMKAQAFPGVFPGSTTTGYLDIGAVQRQEPAGGGSSGSSYTFAG